MPSRHVPTLTCMRGHLPGSSSSRGGRRKGAAAAREKARKPSVVITELPYQTNKADFVAAVANLVEEQKLTGALAYSRAILYFHRNWRPSH